MDHRAHSVTTRDPIQEPANGPGALPGSKRLLVGMVFLAIFELVWLAWFLFEPLPNVNNTGIQIDVVMRRGWLVLKALPEVVPGTSFRESLLGHAFEELSHVENLPQRVPIVLSALLIAAAAIGLGDLVLRWLRLAGGISLLERVAVDYGLGAGLLGVLTLVTGRLGWLDPWVVRVGLFVPAAAALFTSGLWRTAEAGGRFLLVVESAPVRPVRAGARAGFDAAVDRFRCARIPPARAQGVFPGRPDQLSAS